MLETIDLKMLDTCTSITLPEEDVWNNPTEFATIQGRSHS